MAGNIEISENNNLAVEKDKNNSTSPNGDTAKRFLDMLLNSTGVSLPHAKQPVPLPDNRGLKIFINMKGA